MGNRLLAVFVNSAYSFWWDVTNDWGLTLLKRETWFKEARDSSINSYQLVSQTQSSGVNPRSAGSTSGGVIQHGHSRKPSSFSALPLASPRPEALGATPIRPVSAHHPIGLRSPLLFRDPTVYYLVLMLNFVLRFTWSLKLSSHLHSVAELEQGVFLMEALELIRRWIWVFFRVEWELVKKMNTNDDAASSRGSLMASVNGNGASHGIHSSMTTDDIELFAFQDDSDLHVDGRADEVAHLT